MSRFRSAVRVFLTPETLLPFLLGSVSLGVLSNAIYGLLTNALGTTGWALIGLIVGVLAIFILCVWAFAMVVSRIGRPLGAHTRAPAKHKGLILLVSRSEPCERAIAYHRPMLQRVWLLCSAQTLPIAQQLQSANSDLLIDDPIVINDLHNPIEVKGRIEDIYAELPSGWEEWGVIADYTGMTAHCSVGAALACLSPTRHLQYTPAVFDENRNPIGSAEPIEVRRDWALAGLAPKSPE
ncbi:MAG: hypothetical protein K8F29_02225 [Kofleriaceae bacterium]|nr:hypothetical protein [Candidatus Methylomirabilis lanthanidiphila]